MKKHAYLIMANENFSQLIDLIEMLDDKRNDIFFHIDKKTYSANVAERLEKSAKNASVYVLENPIDIAWGDYSQIRGEILLLKTALATEKYVYYHLLSGKDLPLKNQEEIHKFFEINEGKEFVRFGDHELNNYEFRYKYYLGITKFTRYFNKKVIKLIIIILIFFQKILRIDRTKANRDIEFKKGTNWFSITHELAEYVLGKQEWIEETFKSTYCCDEVFLQTLVHNNVFFRERLYVKTYNSECKANMRLIDWERGRPYVFLTCDFEELINSECMFARKFDSKKDKEIILKIKESLLY